MRKPNKKAPKKAFTIRKVKMSELSEEDQDLIRKGLADAEAGRVSPLKVPKPKGLKLEATQQVMDVFHGIPEDDVIKILQEIVNHAAAQKRRKNTKSKQPKTKPCKTCWGWGMWSDGTAPMGPIDGADGMPTSACPECKKNPNPMRKK
jgi:hypothetical protein